MKLTLAERLLLSNQFLILSKLIPAEAQRYEKIKEVVDSGFEGSYDQYLGYIEPPLSEEKCSEVRDVLDLFWGLKHSFDDLSEKVRLSTQSVEFPGFDEQSEGDYLNYAYFLTLQEGKFDGVKVKNSHFPRMSTYRRMVGEWKRHQERHSLTVEEIESILGL